VLALVPADRRATLIGRRKAGDAGNAVYMLDIHLQGSNGLETRPFARVAFIWLEIA
jgi:hypothetical protein